MTNRPQPVLIVGASTRAAAQSASRAGWQPVCADLFADEDLRECALVLPVENFPTGLVEAVSSFPKCPWMYTGALENHPEIIERISHDRPLWGNGIGAIEHVRDPFRLFNVLSTAALKPLSVRASDDPPPADGNWLLKPVRTAGGRRIRLWDAEAKKDGLLREDCFFQQLATGRPISAVYIASPTGVVLIGVTRQLIGKTWTSTNPFAYCGTIGPIELDAEMTVIVRTVGEQIAKATGLRGLFGCDFVYDDETQTMSLVEVNPRYPASVETLEQALEISLLSAHRTACEATEEAAMAEFPLLPYSPVFGKAVWYAETEMVFPGVERLSETTDIDPADVADRPAMGTRITAGQPVCTVLASSESVDSCAERLRGHLAKCAAASGEFGPISKIS